MAAATEWLEKDYYKTLGVSATASDDEIRRAYRKLARTAHPDANRGDPAAESRFKEISAAYDVIGDRERRKEYDELRRLRAAPGAGPMQPGGFSVHVTDAEGFADLGDLFGDWLGTGRSAPGPGRTPHGPRSGQDLATELRLGFVEAVYGTSTTVELTGELVCETCAGTGMGARAHPCPTCGGRGRIVQSRPIKVRIPPGVDDGQTIRLPGRGGPGRNGGPPGDLYLTVEVDPHPEFGRIGDNLTLTVPVSYAEATLGADVTVPTLDGSTVTVRVPPGTPSGRTLRVPGRGVPASDRAGDLLLTIDIDVPPDLTKKEKALIERLADAGRHRRPRARWEATSP